MSHQAKLKTYFPAEWEPQDAVLLTWPHQYSDWRDNLEQVESVYLHISSTISQCQDVLVLCHDQVHQQHIFSTLRKNSEACLQRIHLVVCKSNDTWVRDYAAITVIENNRPKLLDFTFNAWGNKFNAELDNNVSSELAKQNLFTTALTQVAMTLEGGSIESDGQGTVITTTRCLLDKNRNGALSQNELEHQLKQTLLVERILWLENGLLIGDDTDGHVDNLVRFINPSELVYLACGNPEDEHYQPLKAMYEELKTFRTLNGQPYRLHPIPLPDAIYGQQQQRLPASYINFLIINGAVLVPIFKLRQDQQALNQLQSLFTGRSVIGIDCRELLEQNGGLHCSTMQFPQNTISTQRLKQNDH